MNNSIIPIFTDNEYARYKKQKDKARFKTPEEEYLKHSSITPKTCSKCREEKLVCDFSGNTSSDDGFDKDGYRLRRGECMECTKKVRQGKNVAKKIAKKEGIPYEAPEGTLCGICKEPGTKRNKLVFDHCHESERFRGYLCNTCNRSIGCLGDNTQLLLRAVNYLNKKKREKIEQNEEGELFIVPSGR